MQHAGGVHGGQRFAHVEADERRLARAEASAILKDLFEGLAFDQLHPQADEAFFARRAEDGDDVRMMHARHEARLFDDRFGVMMAAAFRHQLQRHIAIEARLPRAIDDAVGAASDDLAQREV
jgi:hypothetical protein